MNIAVFQYKFTYKNNWWALFSAWASFAQDYGNISWGEEV